MGDCKSVIYMIRPDLESVQRVIEQMKLQEQIPYDNHIVFIPRRTIECDELLEMHGLLFEDKIHHFALDLLQMDDDLLSLELPRSFANHLLDDDDSYKVYV